MKRKRNGIVSIWKFILCIVIAIFHGKAMYPNDSMPIFIGGYIAVEFYFIISGFYFAKEVLKETYSSETIGKETISFIWKRIKKLIPYILVAYILTVLVSIIYKSNFGISETINSIWNLLLLKQFGFEGPHMMSAYWYLTGLYTSLFILYPLVKKHKENFILLYSPLIVLFILGYIYHTYNSLDQSYLLWNGFLKTGMLRAFAELNIGMIIYYIHDRLKNKNYSILKKSIFTFIGEAFLIIPLIVISLFWKNGEYDFILLLMIAISILIITSGKTYDYNILSNKISYFLENISIPIFLNHQLFYLIVKEVSFFSNYEPLIKTVIYVSATIVFSIIEFIIIDKYKKIKKLNTNNKKRN